MAIGLYAGSFDCFTNGHLSVCQQASKVFEKLFVVIAMNNEKKTLFSMEQRKRILETIFNNGEFSNVVVFTTSKLLVRFAEEILIKENRKELFLVRGLRTMTDFDNEFLMAKTNEKLTKKVRTLFFRADEKYEHLSSSIVKELFKYGENIKELVPEASYLAMKYKDKNVIGVTGRICSGKSTIIKTDYSNGDYLTIDCDVIAKEIRESKRFKKEFDKNIRNHSFLSKKSLELRNELNTYLSGELGLNSKGFKEMVFKYGELRYLLEDTITPMIEERIFRIIDNTDLSVVLEGVRLHESKLFSIIKTMRVMSANDSVLMQRLMERNGFTPREAMSRIATQMTDKEYLELEDKNI